jgi:hypothetical protein
MPILEMTSDSGCATASAESELSISLTHEPRTSPGLVDSSPQSPASGAAAFDSRDRPGRDMGLETRHPTRADNRVVAGARRQVQAIAPAKIDGFAAVRQTEPDRTGRNDEDLVVSVVVGGIPIVRPVGPAPGLQALGAQPLVEVGHVR